MGIWNQLFGKKIDLAEVISNGAKVIDVRSNSEFSAGHAKGSVNIPLDQISTNIEKLKAYNQPLILCCASGIRSGNATSILKKEGIECYNGGSWKKVNQYL